MTPEVFVLISMVGCVAFVAYLIISSRHKERMALLEYDRDISVFKGPQRLGVGGALKIGLFLLFGGVGILLGFCVHQLIGIPGEVALPALLFISAGAGLLTYYFIATKINSEQT